MNAILVDDEEVAVNALRRRVGWGKYGISNVFIAQSMAEAQKVFREESIESNRIRDEINGRKQ